MPEWVERYIGIPFVEYGRSREGCDCWGLLYVVLREQFGCAVPSYSDKTWKCGVSTYEKIQNRKEIANIMGEGKSLWKPTTSPKPGNGILLTQAGLACHVGVVISSTHMLHTEEHINSVIADFTGLAWRRKVAGMYEWVGG